MPTNRSIEKLIGRIDSVEQKLASITTEIMWLTRIVAGAAGLGLLEKLATHLFK